MRTTHTYAILQVNNASYRDIRTRIVGAGHGHAMHIYDDNEVIDMHGIALQSEPTLVDVGSHRVMSNGRPIPNPIGIISRTESACPTPWESWLYEGSKFVRWQFVGDSPTAIWKEDTNK